MRRQAPRLTLPPSGPHQALARGRWGDVALSEIFIQLVSWTSKHSYSDVARQFAHTNCHEMYAAKAHQFGFDSSRGG